MINELKLTIRTKPIAKQSMKVFVWKKGKYKGKVGKYRDPKVTSEKANIINQILPQIPDGFIPLTGPLHCDIIFKFPLLKSFSKKKVKLVICGETLFKDTKPDCDNLMKNLFDAIETICFQNDSQIASWTGKKIYSFKPGIDIFIKKINEGIL